MCLAFHVVLRITVLALRVADKGRLEAQYAFQRQLTMIPLMMEAKYRADGWLGILLGTRLWYGYYGTTLESDAAFLSKTHELMRELGSKGKESKALPGSELHVEAEPQPEPE